MFARSDGLYDQARKLSPRLRFKSDHVLAHELTKRQCINKRISAYARGWQFPPLLEARAAWEAQFLGHRWRDLSLTAWQLPPEVQMADDQIAPAWKGFGD